MQHKTLPISGIKTSGLAEGEFIGWASTFGNVDSQGDRVVRGAFTKSIEAMDSGAVVPIAWEHKTDDPRNLVGEIKSARETDEGLEIHARLDTDTEFGAAAYRAVKGRRVQALSIGYAIRTATKAADGAQELRDVDLVEVSIVARPANTEAVITSAKASAPLLRKARVALATATTKGPTMPQTKGRNVDLHTKNTETQLALAQQIIDAATELQRDLTPDEAEQVEKALASAAHSKAWLDRIDGDSALSNAIENLGRQPSGPSPLDDGGGYRPGEPADRTGQRLSLSGAGAAAMASKTAATLGRKALAPTGSELIGQEFTADPIADGRPATGLLDVLPVQQHSTPEFAYLRQVARDNQAAVVADGALKPTSTYSLERVEGKLQIVAHLSEAVPQYWLSDNASLAQFLQAELDYGLRLAIEELVTTTIVGTSGIQAQAFDEDLLATLRTAITMVESVGLAPGVIVLRPETWQAIELTKSEGSGEYTFAASPVDRAARRVWGVPVAVSTAPAVGKALLLGADSVQLDTDASGVRFEWGSVGDDFTKNQVRARLEGRYACSVRRPLGVVLVSTTA